ncbi:PstS family phosphate ABC transporter substrate-binding protein [Falsiroseomonas tokyonensis]|uniref:PstS family phosphate ABC transporter substrate-binding protein n=1 Tax=Falsiroseomonas tokyonensis TaxID=430521 RepID=A0ABV7BMZ3_9PROT|nr:substrate-binding domain-containing protein [Falsiroseomonas tokyonensis]MBU8536965.1 substrate-binding domain-containing protein [Falsiroseomonas tokyonensis]
MARLRNLLMGLALAAGVLPLAAAPAAAQNGLAMRDRLVVISSSSATAVTRMLSLSFTERFEGVTEPLVRQLPSSTALDLFCAGIGPQTPDIAVVVRRMARTMLESCQENGVRDVVELRLGLGAVVLAVRRGEPTPNLSSRQVWEALAAEHVVQEEFVPNRLSLWSDVAPSLPRSEIRLLMLEHGNGTTGLFEDMVLEAGCRDVKAVRLIFEASYRRSKCVTLREDGRVRMMDGVDIPAALLASPPGTIGVLSYDQLLASGGNLVALSLDGVLPTQATIFAQDYGPTRTVYLYAKRQHTRLREGVGVVRGIREFLNEATSEAAAGPGGYLAVTGLVPLGPAERAQQRQIADRLTLLSR